MILRFKPSSLTPKPSTLCWLWRRVAASYLHTAPRVPIGETLMDWGNRGLPLKLFHINIPSFEWIACKLVLFLEQVNHAQKETGVSGWMTVKLKLRLNVEPMVFQLTSHTWFQDIMKPRFWMSLHRNNSVRDKVIGKKWIYLERNTLHRVWIISVGESGPRIWGCQFL